MLATAQVLEMFGPQAKRPHVDPLKGSKYPNMKELRLSAFGGVWRVAFAFDPLRQAILLVAGDKSGISQKLFYKHLIQKADARYKGHLEKLKQEG
nr:type II toxin-antitoxin system RelE/ParE family toxin [Nostoc commune]